MRVSEAGRVNFTPPDEPGAVLAAFAPLFTRPTWARVQPFFCGVLPTLAKRLADPATLPWYGAAAMPNAKWSSPATPSCVRQVSGGGMHAKGAGDLADRLALFKQPCSGQPAARH